MTLQLSPELESRLIREAEARGTTPEVYAQELLNQALPSGGSGTGILTREDLAEMLREMAIGSEVLPHLPTSAFSRESFYEEKE